MRIHDLGSLVVDLEDRTVELGLTKQAALLARLAMSPNRVVSADALIEAAWGIDATVTTASLDSQLYRLRNLLEPERSGAGELLVKSGSGYRLQVAPTEVDSTRFVQLTTEIEAALAAGSPSLDGAGAAELLTRLDEALALWRGRPHEPIADLPDIEPAVTRLVELHGQLTEHRIEVLDRAGRPERALADLQPLLAAAPYREHLWALRIAILARLGRAEEALATYQQIRDLLRDDLGLDPGTELRELQSQILAGDLVPPPTAPADSAAAASPSSGQGTNVHLPRRATRLLGRARDEERILALIDEHPLVTLVGPGGCGKTRLSVEIGATVAGRYADGVWFVDLTATTDPALVTGLVVSVLGLGASPIGDPLEQLTAFLAGRELLLIMDNCEHVLDGVARCVEAILSAGGGPVVLATSREPLELDGEIVWSLAPLSLLAAAADEAVTEPSPSPAAELFLDRARSAAPDLEIGPEKLAVVERICQAVDGLPLAIELAAARLRVSTLDEIAEQVTVDPTRLGRLGRRRQEPRSSMFDTIEWSYRLLAPAEQSLHRRLAVLPGEFPLTVARGIAGGLDGHDVDEDLAGLVHSSMLVVRPSPGRPTSFAQLDTVRAHVRRRLIESGEERGVLAARDDWVRDLLLRRPGPGRASEAPWFDEVDQSYAVIRSCLQDQLNADGDPQLVRLGADLAFYWYYRAKIVEGSGWLAAAQQIGPRPSNDAEAATRYLRLAALYFLRTRRDLAEPLLEPGLRHLDALSAQSPELAMELLTAVSGSAWGCDAYDIMQLLQARLEPLLARVQDPHLLVIAEVTGCVARLPVVPLEVSKSTAAHAFERATEIDNLYAQWMAALLRNGVALIEQAPAEGREWTKRLVPIYLRLGSGGGSVFLEALGDFAVMSDEFVEAARLYAAARTMARRAGTAWPNRPQTALLYERTKTVLSAGDFEAASAAGASLTLEELAASR